METSALFVCLAAILLAVVGFWFVRARHAATTDRRLTQQQRIDRRMVIATVVAMVAVLVAVLVAIRFEGRSGPSGVAIFGGERAPMPEPRAWLLTITPPIGGTLFSGGIQCGTLGTRCSAEFLDGVSVLLVAQPDSGYSFMGFTQDCLPSGETQMIGPRNCSASFAHVSQGPRADASRMSSPSGTVTLERYPNVDAPDWVKPNERLPVQISLSEELRTPATRINSSASGRAVVVPAQPGALTFTMPDTGAWKIDLILSASGFVIEDSTISFILLPQTGDSTTAAFYLRAKTGSEFGVMRTVYVTLWHEGAFLGKVSRDVEVRTPDRAVVDTTAINRSRPAISIAPNTTAAPDLTIWENPEGGEIIVQSPFLQPQRSSMSVPKDLESWLESNYARFAALSSRGLKLSSVGVSPSPKELAVPLMTGFGRDLYRKAAPPAFKEAYWRLKDRMGHAFRTIQIFSSNALIPWELMRPSRANGTDEGDFLGLEFDLARWHVTRDTSQLDRPPQIVKLRELAVVAPKYDDAMALSNQSIEVQALSEVPGYRSVAGKLATLAELFADFPEGIIHFSGHGEAQKGGTAAARYVVRLEDGDVDVLTWEGLTSSHPTNHPLVFLNACETGQATTVANFVDGWAPKMLEAGVGGYIGGLWSLGDRGAAQFATRFYHVLEEGLKSGPVRVADAIRSARKAFYETGDPTFLAYVYYGDPTLAFVAGK